MPITIETPSRLDERERASVLALAATIEADDGAPPLSDQGRIQLTSSGVRHFVARSGSDLVGYGQLNGSEAEALGTVGADGALGALLDELQAAAPGFELWAHGTRSRLVTALDQRGYERERVLWQLRWPVVELAPVPMPAGVTVRPFVPGQDEAAWLAVNAAAFAHHAEQGGLTLADLTAREAETWFDPAGFLLAVADHPTDHPAGPTKQVLGFHWTKRHSPSLGEVYVLGVSPEAQGLKLGSALLVAGLEHLRSIGVTEVMLYVDESNTPAMALYEKFGFRRYDYDVQYRASSA